MAPTSMNRAGKYRRPPGPADPDHALLERLPEGVEHDGGELPHLVEEQDAAVGQADLARSHPRRPAADHGHR